ncbi:MAG: sigma-70 family RNA polymerase sigma factor [Pseudomonadota bacterium]
MTIHSNISDDTAQFFREHREDLINFAASLVRNRGLAEDIVQDAFLQFAQKSRQRELEQPYAYLVGTVRNLAIGVIRRSVLEDRIFDAEVPDKMWQGLPAPEPDPEMVLEIKDDYRAFREAVHQLPSISRRALLMHLLEGMTFREIAARLELSVGRSHALIKDAMLQCRRHIDRGGGPKP